MKSNADVLKIAKKYIGQGGSRFRKFCGLPGGAAWCNAYVDYVANEGGVSSLYFDGKKETYCPHSIKWCDKNLALIPPYLAMACDIIYFDWEKNGVPNHIGLVYEKISTSTIQTIEGNTNGGIVAKKNRSTKYVQGIYRPHYKPSGIKLGAIAEDGDFGYDSIANLQRALNVQIDGILGKATVKALQKKAGAKADGAWGNGTSRKVQALIGCKTIDGQFGTESVKKLQHWINEQNSHSAPEKPTESKEAYKGKYPKLPPKTAKIAVKCAYKYGTPLSKYSYKTGKAKPEYKEELDKAYPSRNRWKYKQSRMGASCDVFAGTVLKRAGYKSAPHTMATMVSWCRKNLKKVGTKQNGDILTRTNHVMVVVDLKGHKLVANAHFLDHGGTYGIVQKVGKYTDIWRPEGLSYFSKGDIFTDVKKLKRFLNWYGGYNLKDSYFFGTQTEKAVKDFQQKEGLKVTGKFGVNELNKAKAVTK